MQLEDKEGISCDRCKNAFRKKFIYYSVDVFDSTDRTERLFTYDFCKECFHEMFSFIIDSSNCEFCRTGDKHLFVRISEVEVDVVRIVKGRNVVEDISTFYICGDCFNKHIYPNTGEK